MAGPRQGGRFGDVGVNGGNGVMGQGWLQSFVGAAVLLSGTFAAQAADQVAVGPASGLPVPRCVSVAAGRVGVRSGAGKGRAVAGRCGRSALGVEVTGEADRWRRAAITPGALVVLGRTQAHIDLVGLEADEA